MVGSLFGGCDEKINALANNNEVSVTHGMTSLEINNYEIESVAKAWITVKSTDGLIITPAISYRLNVVLEDKSIANKVVDMFLMLDLKSVLSK